MVHPNEFVVFRETTFENVSLRKRERNLGLKNLHLVFTCFWLAPLGRWKIWYGVGRGCNGYGNWSRGGPAVAKRRRAPPAICIEKEATG